MSTEENKIQIVSNIQQSESNIQPKLIDVRLLDLLEEIIYRNGGSTSEDIKRWFDQGFTFCENPVFGLQQCSGGPCGILAAVQAEIIEYFFFEVFTDYIEDITKVDFDNDLNNIALAKAISSILFRCRYNNEVKVVIYNEDDEYIRNVHSFNQCTFTIYTSINEDETFEIIFNNLNKFQSSLGCILMLFSLVLSRGISNIKNDMDTSTNTLIGQFGHCTQELINLLLTGIASSNVHDGFNSIEDSKELLKGIEKSNKIGYLTHMESLRLCQVGSFYKTPQLPIWVIGSTSHFSVLFSQDRRCNEETEAEKLFHKLLRVFQMFDQDRCGFIPSSALKQILLEVGLTNICKSEIDTARLRGHLQVDGEIIIWSTFWVNMSKLLSGETLDNLITISIEKIVDDSTERFRSDSDVARQLQAEYDGNNQDSNLFKPINSSRSSVKRDRSDSDIARELQEKWSNENDNTYDFSFEKESKVNVNDTITIDKINQPEEKVNVVMYYYNGFSIKKTSRLVRFILKMQLSTIKIGVPVFSDDQEMSLGSYICPIEEVIHTRWPGAIIDWLGNDIPSID